MGCVTSNPKPKPTASSPDKNANKNQTSSAPPNNEKPVSSSPNSNIAPINSGQKPMEVIPEENHQNSFQEENYISNNKEQKDASAIDKPQQKDDPNKEQQLNIQLHKIQSPVRNSQQKVNQGNPENDGSKVHDEQNNQQQAHRIGSTKPKKLRMESRIHENLKHNLDESIDQVWDESGDNYEQSTIVNSDALTMNIRI